MAHKGRRYPLAFRRDYGMQLSTNNESFPQQLDLHLRYYAGIIGAHVSTRTFRCDYQGIDSNDFLTYTSAPESFATFTYHFKIEWSINHTSMLNNVTWRCIEFVLGNVFEVRKELLNVAPSRANFAGIGDVASTPGIFTRSSGFPGINEFAGYVPW